MHITGTPGTAIRGASILASLATVLMLMTAVSPTAAETAAPPQAPACDAARFKLALDVGHTEEVQGATSARGVKEYVFNLQLATQMQRALKDTGFSQAQLFVTHGKTHAQLYTRAERANTLGLDLFVSIHHNDVQEQYKSKWDYNGEKLSYSDTFSGHSLFVSRDNPRFRDSLAFGHLLGAELKDRGLAYTHHHTENVPGERRELLDPGAGVYRYDHLVVLMFTKVPALLMEAGIIVNRNDELVLESPERRDVLTAAMVAGVQRFCGMQQAKAKMAQRKAVAKSAIKSASPSQWLTRWLRP